MNNEQYLLMKLDEECKEIGMAASKAIQFGLESNDNGKLQLTNKEHLFKEINDMLATIEMLNEECGLGFAPCKDAIAAKKLKIKKYRDISRNLGLMQ